MISKTKQVNHLTHQTIKSIKRWWWRGNRGDGYKWGVKVTVKQIMAILGPRWSVKPRKSLIIILNSRTAIAKSLSICYSEEEIRNARYVIISKWKNEAELDLHFKTAHVKEFGENLKIIICTEIKTFTNSRREDERQLIDRETSALHRYSKLAVLLKLWGRNLQQSNGFQKLPAINLHKKTPKNRLINTMCVVYVSHCRLWVSAFLSFT